MTIFVDDVPTTYSDRQHSHKAAGAYLAACQIRHSAWGAGRTVDVWTDKSLAAWPSPLQAQAAKHVWAVAHPMEFTGEVVNLFGGWGPQVRERLVRLAEWGGELVSLDIPLPAYGDLLVRKRVKDGSEDVLAKALDDRASEAITLTQSDLVGQPDRVVFGDSHALAHWKPGTLLLRQDGLTMHGCTTSEHELSSRMIAAAREVGAEPTQLPAHELVLVLGNIDIRHHLLRYPEPKASIDQMLRVLFGKAQQWIDAGTFAEVTLIPPLPIETPLRKIPKTGWYKGLPFYGDRVDRLELVKHMWGRMLELEAALPGLRVEPWPVSWYQMDGEEYAKKRMEKPQSVHLSPMFYKWDLWKDAPNAALQAEYA